MTKEEITERNNMKQINVIVLGEDKPQEKTIDDSLEAFYQEIKCETFEGYTATEIGIKYGLDIFIDGWGKTRQNVITGLFLRDGQVIDFLAGNVLITRHDKHGDSQSVSPADLPILEKHLSTPEDLGISLTPELATRWRFAKRLLILEC